MRKLIMLLSVILAAFPLMGASEPHSAYLKRGLQLLSEKRVQIATRDIRYVQALCGHMKALACAHIDPASGQCSIIIAREHDHGFRQLEILEHELEHCGGWTHPVGMATNFNRR